MHSCLNIIVMFDGREERKRERERMREGGSEVDDRVRIVGIQMQGRILWRSRVVYGRGRSNALLTSPDYCDHVSKCEMRL